MNNNFKAYLLAGFVGISLFSCKEDKKDQAPVFKPEIVVSGNYTGQINDTYVTLEKLNAMSYNFDYKIIDSVKIIDKKFSFKVKGDSAENYRLYFSVTGNVIPMVLGGQDVSIKDIDFSKLEKSYTLTGTKDMESLNKIHNILGRFALEGAKMQIMLDSAQAKGDEKAQNEIMVKSKEVKNKYMDEAKKEWNNMNSSVAVCFAPALLDPTDNNDLKYLRSLSAKMKPVATSPAKKRFVEFVDAIVGAGEQVTPEKMDKLKGK